MNKKIVSTALAGLMAVSSMPINVFAVDPPSAPPDNSSTGGTSQAVLNQEATMFSATVPTALPISVDQDNKVVVATDAKVINGSSGPIVISNIQLLENHGWTLTKTPTKKVGKQEVDFNIKTANKIIPAAKETAIIYDATVSPQKVAVTNAPVLDVIFTVDWDSYGSTVVSASKSTLLPDELSSLTVEGTTESDLFVWKNSNKAVAVLEPLPESHSVMSTFALLPEGQEELKASRKMGIRALAPGKTTVTVTDASGNAITQEIVVIDNLLDRIYVHTQPTKKEYFEGEVFDPAGMQVNAVYMDGSEYPLTLYGYSKQPLVMGQNQVAISYDEKGVTKTTNVSIVVKAGDRDISLLPTTNGTFSTDKTKAKKGETVLVTANPSSGYALDKILVNGAEIVGNSFVMPAENVTVNATFKAIAYSVTQKPTANGLFTVSKPTAVIGDEVVITTTPAEGYVLNEIKVNSKVITGNKFTMTADNAVVEVTFKAVNYKITKTPSVNGSYTLNKETAVIGDQIIVVANPAAGYKLSTIKVDGVAISGTSFTMKAKDMTVEVEFVKQIYTITKNPTANGSFTVSKPTAVIGDEVIITTAPAEGYVLNEIKVNSKAITGNKFTMTADNAVVEVTFKAVNYKITKMPTINGSYTLNKETAIIGDQIVVVANPALGYKLSAIKVDGVAISGNSFTMKAKDMKVEVEFTVKGDWTAAEATAYGYKFVQDATSTTITGVTNQAAFTGDKIIPNSIDGKPVTSIGEGAFCDCAGVTSISIPNTVTIIGNLAFACCPGLTSITSNSPNFRVENQRYLIAKSNNSLIAFAPKGTTSAVIPNSVTSIGEAVFWNCTGLTSITIPNSVTSIGSWAFSYSGLTSITIPNSVTNIGDDAFGWCAGLTSITIPNSVTSIGDCAFYSCTSLTSINIAKPINSLAGAPWGAPKAKVNWNYVAWTAAEATAYGYTFTQNATSTTITGLLDRTTFTGDKIIPNSIDGKPVTSIGYKTFDNCTGLTSITIPSSVTSIGDGTFGHCSSLTSIISDSPNFRVENQRYLIQNSNNLLITFAPKGVTSTTIPSSVTSIGDWAFYGCTELTDVTIPSSVTSIESNAFFFCPNLTSVAIPSSVTSIGSCAFLNCWGLTSVTIPNSVTSIGNDAFGGCDRLTRITIPSSVTSIGNGAFGGCSELTSINIAKPANSIYGAPWMAPKATVNWNYKG